MDGWVDVLALVTVTGAAIVAGGQLFCALAIVPALSAFPADVSARIHQEALSRRPDRYLRPVAGLTVLAAALLVVAVARGDGGASTAVLVGAGLAAMATSGAVSSREWPINREIDAWGTEPRSDRYPALRDTWDRRHRVRTVLSMLSLVLFVSATLVSAEM